MTDDEFDIAMRKLDQLGIRPVEALAAYESCHYDSQDLERYGLTQDYMLDMCLRLRAEIDLRKFLDNL